MKVHCAADGVVHESVRRFSDGGTVTKCGKGVVAYAFWTDGHPKVSAAAMGARMCSECFGTFEERFAALFKAKGTSDGQG